MATETAAGSAPRTCKDCGEKLGAGREDKQFCDDACRTNYNNKMRRKKREEKPAPVPVAAGSTPVPEQVTRIQNILLRNREILYDIGYKSMGRINERDLLGTGFNLKYYTSQTEGAASPYRFCFDYGYHKENEEIYVVVYRPREIEQ